tara:strand:+ start:4204 stop:4551 length:348 start_codon:yes stop_codon:yes gene_type:complete
MSDFNKFGQKSGDSINLSEIGDKVFTILAVEDSPYTKDGEETPGVKISTSEEWEKEDGTKVSKIHTTRRAIVSKLVDEDLRKALANGETFRVKCPAEKVKSKKGGMPYFDLVAAD